MIGPGSDKNWERLSSSCCRQVHLLKSKWVGETNWSDFSLLTDRQGSPRILSADKEKNQPGIQIFSIHRRSWFLNHGITKIPIRILWKSSFIHRTEFQSWKKTVWSGSPCIKSSINGSNQSKHLKAGIGPMLWEPSLDRDKWSRKTWILLNSYP